jgi:hypothetical protein
VRTPDAFQPGSTRDSRLKLLISNAAPTSSIVAHRQLGRHSTSRRRMSPPRRRTLSAGGLDSRAHAGDPVRDSLIAGTDADQQRGRERQASARPEHAACRRRSSCSRGSNRAPNGD